MSEREEDVCNGSDSVDCSDTVGAWRCSAVALQQELGLLAQRNFGSDLDHRFDSGSVGQNLALPLSDS
jgi:hypothetical protein